MLAPMTGFSLSYMLAVVCVVGVYVLLCNSGPSWTFVLVNELLGALRYRNRFGRAIEEVGRRSVVPLSVLM